MNLRLLKAVAACAVLTTYSGATGAAAITEDLGVRLDVSDPLQRTVHAFLEKNAGKKVGMVIGRGNVQGIAESRIWLDSLKGLQWLFVDPGDTLGNRFFNNHQDERQGNALKTTWPLSFSIEGQFDAVVFDNGVLQYIGDNGETLQLMRELSSRQMELKIRLSNGFVVSRESFESPYKFWEWLVATKPIEEVRLESYYYPKIATATARQTDIMRKSLMTAQRALKKGGALVIPIGGPMNDTCLKGLLCWDNVASLTRYNYPNYATLLENPTLPQNAPGMGASYGDYFIAVTNNQ